MRVIQEGLSLICLRGRAGLLLALLHLPEQARTQSKTYLWNQSQNTCLIDAFYELCCQLDPDVAAINRDEDFAEQLVTYRNQQVDLRSTECIVAIVLVIYK